MEKIKYLFIYLLFLNIPALAQNGSLEKENKKYPLRKLTLEPAIGINPYPTSDLLLTNLTQWNIRKRISIISYSSYSFNNAFHRNFNYIKNEYNFSLSQKFGIGTSLYAKNTSHTFSLIAGIKYSTFKETLNHPDFEKVSVSVNSTNPDLGLVYNLKIGKKKYFFSYRMFIPLYPYPIISTYVDAFDGNMANISIEFGVGIRLK